MMKKLDDSNLDIRHLQMFIAVMELRNMTQAATALNIKQSTVSHAMDKLRMIFADPLFTRSGRGITPTPRAEELFPEIEALLAHYRRLKRPPEFDPSRAEIAYTLAANDFLRDIVIPDFYRHIQPLVSRLRLTVIPPDSPNLTLLKEGKADMIISAFRPDSTFIMSRRLFTAQDVCYYDSDYRTAPVTIQDYADADFICSKVVVDSSDIDFADTASKRILLRDRTTLKTSGFSGAAACLKHTTALSIAPVQLKETVFKGFAYTALPYDSTMPIYLLWHSKNQSSRKHAWTRRQLFEIINKNITS